MPQTIDAECFAVTKYSPDGKIHPVCVGSQNLIEEFWKRGEAGFLYGTDELNLLCRIFAGQEGLTDVRSINCEDTTIEEKLSGDFWLASRYVEHLFPKNVRFNVRCVDYHGAKAGSLFEPFCDASFTRIHGVRPVFVLQSKVKFPEPKVSWVMS